MLASYINEGAASTQVQHFPFPRRPEHSLHLHSRQPVRRWPWDKRKIQPGGSSALPASPPDADDIPGRPDYVSSYVQGNRPVPATAVRAVTPERERRAARRPDMPIVYMPEAPPEMQRYARCFAYAYITAPPDSPCKAHPAPSIRAAIGAALPSLRYELLLPRHGADRTLRFRIPEDREAAMERQPFALDGGGGGATVKLVSEGETSNTFRLRLDTLAHVALRGYPKEQRNWEDIRGNCSGFGHLLEVDPACYAAPDLSPVRAVVKLEHARNIPRQVRITWAGGVFRHVVPVQILRVWDWSESVDANGEYVPMYGAAAAVA